jgi:hypothetical protein
VSQSILIGPPLTTCIFLHNNIVHYTTIPTPDTYNAFITRYNIITIIITTF